MGEVFLPVGIGFSRGGIDACAALRDVRIEERVDVNGESECVFGEFAASLHAAEVEAGYGSLFPICKEFILQQKQPPRQLQ